MELCVLEMTILTYCGMHDLTILSSWFNDWITNDGACFSTMALQRRKLTISSLISLTESCSSHAGIIMVLRP